MRPSKTIIGCSRRFSKGLTSGSGARNIKGMSPFKKVYALNVISLTQEEVYMEARTRLTNARPSGPLGEKAEDATLYKWGWLMGLAVGALTAAYRYAG
jgi:hypothetical protein